MKKMLKVIGIIILTIIILVVILLTIASKKQFVPKDYSEKAKTGGSIEAKYVQNGKYEISYYEEPVLQGFGKYEIYYPTELQNSSKKYPVVVFVNGSGAKVSKYHTLLEHIATWGFVAIGTEEELIDLINFAESINSSIKFIELFPPNSEGFVPLEYLRNFLLKRGFEKIPSLTRKEKYSNGSVVVGLIKIFCAKACEMESPAEYCNKYNDLFVSPDGKIKPCRSDKSEVDVLEAVKARDFELVEKGLKEAFELLGKKCIYERRS